MFVGSVTTEDTQSGNVHFLGGVQVHSIMMVKSAQSGDGGRVHARGASMFQT
jgi:hypothetical protein